jgi:hypothetical protein
MTLPPDRGWKKSSFSGPQEDCVEISGDLDGVRDSKDGTELPGRPDVAAMIRWLQEKG